MSAHHRRPGSVIALIAALSFQGVSAVAGGCALVLGPSGESLGIPLEWLRGSPFDDFLVPGVVLLLGLGLVPLFVAYGVWTRRSWSRNAALAIGVALVTWLLVQIKVIGYHAWPPLQLVYGLLGISIVVLSSMPSIARDVRRRSEGQSVVTEITRAVSPSDLADLLTAARVAIVAWNQDGRVAARPAAFRFEGERYFIGLPPATLAEGTEVTVLVDEGPLYFDLRGVRVRGRISPSKARGDGLEWFEVKPERAIAWHYGTLREANKR